MKIPISREVAEHHSRQHRCQIDVDDDGRVTVLPKPVKRPERAGGVFRCLCVAPVLLATCWWCGEPVLAYRVAGNACDHASFDYGDIHPSKIWSLMQLDGAS